MIKHSIIPFLILAIFTLQANAQKFAYVDSEYILSEMPEYEKAQEQLNDLAQSWQEEIEIKLKEVDEMYKTFKAEQVMLTDKMKEQRIAEIEAKELEIKEYQTQKFGPDGELFLKRSELIKPLQDMIFEELQKMAELKGYDFIFDKSGGNFMLYYNKRYDKSEDILKAIRKREK